jgi:endonuclease YncB( thermonuclease family)
VPWSSPGDEIRPERSQVRPRKAKAGVLAWALAALVLAVGCSFDDDAPATAADAPSEDVVERVVDGDTIALGSGTVVRLVQIDAPEVRGSECYADEATATLGELLPPGTAVRIETDPALDRRDRYGRLLAYVFRNGENVNKTLVERGAASVWFYEGDRGRYAGDLLEAAEEAQAAGRGLWGACEVTLDPFAGVGTRAFAEAAAPPPPPPPLDSLDGAGDCHASYEPCLPVVGDLDCADVRALGKAPVGVSGSDPYRLDGDADGAGCE